MMYKLDLHGVRHIDVPNEVKRFLESHWNRGGNIEIITGNSSRMTEIVCQVLHEYNLEWNRDYHILMGCIWVHL